MCSRDLKECRNWNSAQRGNPTEVGRCTVKKSFVKFRCGQRWCEPNDVGVGKFLLPRPLVLRPPPLSTSKFGAFRHGFFYSVGTGRKGEGEVCGGRREKCWGIGGCVGQRREGEENSWAHGERVRCRKREEEGGKSWLEVNR